MAIKRLMAIMTIQAEDVDGNTTKLLEQVIKVREKKLKRE